MFADHYASIVQASLPVVAVVLPADVGDDVSAGVSAVDLLVADQAADPAHLAVVLEVLEADVVPQQADAFHDVVAVEAVEGITLDVPRVDVVPGLGSLVQLPHAGLLVRLLRRDVLATLPAVHALQRLLLGTLLLHRLQLQVVLVRSQSLLGLPTSSAAIASDSILVAISFVLLPLFVSERFSFRLTSRPSSLRRDFLAGVILDGRRWTDTLPPLDR